MCNIWAGHCVSIYGFHMTILIFVTNSLHYYTHIIIKIIKIKQKAIWQKKMYTVSPNKGDIKLMAIKAKFHSSSFLMTSSMLATLPFSLLQTLVLKIALEILPLANSLPSLTICCVVLQILRARHAQLVRTC